ncbi:MAG: CHRD domain-containing protein [Candidatus Andersenbacteria bacterium]
MKNVFIWVIVILVLAAGAFWYMNRPGPDAEMPASQEEEALQSTVVALGAQNDSGMSGVATLTDMNGSTLVALDLAGAPEGVAQPAHIHTGSCADIGGVVYPLEFPVNGISETLLSVSLDTILADLPLALNVHKSPEEANVYVACGDLI